MAMNPSEIGTLARQATGTDTNSWTNAILLLDVNQAYERITAKLIERTIGGERPYGDFNYTSLPTYTITMSNGTAQYDFKDFSTIPLAILGAEVLDDDGNWHVLDRTSLREIHKSGFAQTEYKPTNGLPDEYEVRDNHIILYPAPDNGVSVTLSNGLKLFYLRTASVITDITDTTTDLGLPSPFVDVVVYEAAVKFATRRGLSNLTALIAERNRLEQELLNFLGVRDKDANQKITLKKVNFI